MFKVLIITPGYLAVPAINGGAVENLVDIIVNENSLKKELEISVIAVNDGEKIENEKKNVKYYWINNKKKLFKIKRVFWAFLNKYSKFYFGNAYIREVKKYLKNNKEQFDAIVIENNPLYGWYLKDCFKCPMYLHLHNDYLNDKSKLNKKVYDTYTKIYTVSNYIGNRVKTIKNDEDKIETLYNGINLEIFSDVHKDDSEIDRLKEKFEIQEQDFVILYTGRIIPQKGIKELILAFNNVLNNYSNIKLLIAGSSAFKNGKNNKYISEIKSLIKNNIIFTGYIDYDKIYQLYNIADIQIVPSIWGEPLATTIIEGLASGTPLIVNDVGGNLEILGDVKAYICNKNNIVEDLYNGIITLYNEKNTKKIVKDEYRRRALYFDKTIFYKNYVKKIKMENN